MGIRVLGDKVLVKVDEQESTTASGLIIPDTAKEKPSVGEVIEVGPGRRYDNGTRVMDVTKGDKILFKKYSGCQIMVDGNELLLLKHNDIMAIID